MSEDDESQVTMGGKKKSNGHKATCKCPICKNMKMKKGGMPTLRPANFIGGKKANGHKAACKCPICVNMKHQKASKKNRRVKRSKRTRRGGANGDSDDEENDADNELDISGDYDNNPNPEDDNQAGNQNNVEANGQLFGDDDDVMGPADAAPVAAGVADAAESADDAGMGGKKKKKSNGHKKNCKCPICKNMKMKKGGAPDDSDSSDSDSSSDGDSSSDSDSDTTMGGGKKKRKGNGHKAACKCPICKNMKKGGVKSPYAKEDPDNTTKPTWMTDRELEAAEKGETGLGKENIQPQQTTSTSTKAKIDVGGSRRRRKTRKSRKTRKIRRRR